MRSVRRRRAGVAPVKALRLRFKVCDQKGASWVIVFRRPDPSGVENTDECFLVDDEGRQSIAYLDRTEVDKMLQGEFFETQESLKARERAAIDSEDAL